LTTQHITDNELMFQVKAGNLDRMGLLFERHHRPLFGFFWQMLKQKQLSEDLVQSVFMRMMNSRHTFTGSGRFEAWMYHIARNILKDHYRKDKRKGNHYDLETAEANHDHNSIADQQLEKKEELRLLSKAMDKLDADDKELLILCRLQELKYNEIAPLLNISEGAVKLRAFRAMNELRRHFLMLQKETITV
jgi:RNA polymerase sigma factor (sigma-70 family)